MNKENHKISFLGMNTSLPSLTVPDGACEKINNLCYRNGAWVPILPQKSLCAIAQSQGYLLKILYHHPACPDNMFVAITEMDGMKDIAVITVEDDSTTETLINNAKFLITDIGSGSLTIEEEPVKVSHFGKVLMVVLDGTIRYFVWDDNDQTYNEYTTPQPVSISESFERDEDVKVNLVAAKNSYDSVDGFFMWLISKGNTEYKPVSENNSNMWWGELCYLVCYKMKDGTIVSPSEMRILCSDASDEKDWFFAKTDISSESDIWCMMFESQSIEATSTPRLGKFIPTININLPEGVKTNPLIDRVAIYATRINSIYDYKKLIDSRIGSYGSVQLDIGLQYTAYVLTMSEDAPSLPITEVYADNKLPEQPFYLVEEKNIQDIEGTWSVELGYDKLKDLAIKSDVYKPTQSLHSIVPTSLYDYNERLHLANLTTKYFDGYSNMDLYVQNSVFREPFFNIELSNGARVQGSMQLVETNEEEMHSKVVVNGKMISYPDARAQKIRLYAHYSEASITALASRPEIMLTPALENNFSYYILPPSISTKYTELTELNYSALNAATANPILKEPNRIQVSAAGNCFNLPFDTSYKVGVDTTRVVALSTIADSLVESNFYGNYPLYIFTSDGIFALKAGSGEILYAGVENVSHDIITNPNTIAVNGAVIFASVEGLMSLSGRTIAHISEDIDASPTFIEEWRHSTFNINHKMSELWVTRGDYIYIYNLINKTWSTTSHYPSGLFNDNLLIVKKGNINNIYTINLYNINNNNEELIFNSSIITRPLKFGSTEFKRLDTLIARLYGSGKNVSGAVTIEGSNDCVDWILVRGSGFDNVIKPIGFRNCRSSYRFYRVLIGLYGEDSEVRLSFLDTVVQHRFNNKIR